jgi:fimbrial chaperone protein
VAGKLVAGLMLLLVTVAAAAGGFGLSPIGLTISGKEISGSVTATSAGSGPVVLQATVLAWHQENGRDGTAPTESVSVIPPLFKLDPGAAQLIRIIPKPGSRGSTQQAYRLVVREVPTSESNIRLGANFVFAMDVPVYIDPPGTALVPARPKVTLRGSAVVFANDGDRYFRITDVRFMVEGKEVHREVRVVALGRSHLAVEIPQEAARAGRVEVLATSEDGQPISFTVSAAS